MFAVIFEVRLRDGQWDAYLGHARVLRPELERIDGFLDNIRYRSLTRPDWLLSFSTWKDEKALIRWRTHALHHKSQETARSDIFEDYHLRVGEVIGDEAESPQRLDTTQAGLGRIASLTMARRPVDMVDDMLAESLAEYLGLDTEADGLVNWDVFEGILTRSDQLLLQTWRDFVPVLELDGSNRRTVRIIRDYGMFDRHEAPQYYPEPSRSGCRLELDSGST
jgi:heme-degrading monooxygenase HmoA